MKEARVYLLHIRDALARIQAYTGGGREVFMQQTLIQDGLIWLKGRWGPASRGGETLQRLLQLRLGVREAVVLH